MKKIILSVAVATMALSTVASALEDIKVNGQAKLWYETHNRGSKTFTDTANSVGEVVFKLGVTGKQGNVGFGTTLYQNSTMGLEGVVVGAARSNGTVVNDDLWIGEAYVTAPLVSNTILKFGKQELDTPLAFTERWNATPNSFNAAVLLNSSVKNLTLVGAYVGQGNADGSFGTNGINGNVATQYFGTAYAVAGLYKTDAFGLNVWAYQINNVGGALGSAVSGDSVQAYWLDANVKAGPVMIKAYAAMVGNDGSKGTATATGGTYSGETTTAFALAVSGKAGQVGLFAAASSVAEDGDLAVANTATNFKKTKLPTAGVYTDGVYVAQPGSTAFKLKASGKAGSTGLAIQYVMNTNSDARFELQGVDNTKDTQEIDIIITHKLGDFNMKAIALNRSFGNSAEDNDKGGTHFRLITSLNF